jgi:hypothetical protein
VNMLLWVWPYFLAKDKNYITIFVKSKLITDSIIKRPRIGLLRR